MKVLVTGGLGFIGSCVVRLLAANDHNVVVFDDQSSGNNFYSHPLVETIIGDITRPEDLSSLPSDISHVIHLAAAISVSESMTNPEKYEFINVQGSRNVLQWALDNKIEKVASASSAAVYGDIQTLPIKEEYNTAPISPYAETKLNMEFLHKEFHQKGLNCSCFRFFNVYGPRQHPSNPYSGVISKFFDFVSKNEPVKIFGDGEQSRDFVFVEDLSYALFLYITSSLESFNVFNIGTETVTTVNDLARLCIDISQASSKVEYHPERPGDIKHSLSDSSFVRRTLKWNPKFTLSEGLDRTYQWFLTELKAEN
ncbi:hypothetical protein P9112_008228 [Eukaryota sp. TZLM1-RC]